MAHPLTTSFGIKKEKLEFLRRLILGIFSVFSQQKYFALIVEECIKKRDGDDGGCTSIL